MERPLADLLTLVVLTVFFGVGVRVAAPSGRALVRALRTRRGRPTFVDDVSAREGWADVVGSARPLHGRPFAAPFSGERAVSCWYEVREDGGGDGNGERLVTDGRIGGPFALEGERDRIAVDPDEFSVIGRADVALTVGPGGDLPATVRRRLADAGLPLDSEAALDPAHATRTRRYVERRIEPGDEVRVVGPWRRGSNAGRPTVAADDLPGTCHLAVRGDPETSSTVRRALGGLGVGLAFAVPSALAACALLFRLIGS